MTTHRRALLRSLFLLVVMALACLIGAGPSMAAGPPAALGEVPMLKAADAYGPGIWHHAKQGRTWYGSYSTFPDTQAYCIDAGKQSPLPKYFTEAKPKSITTSHTAWALHTYAGSESKDVQAALSALARLDEDIPHDHKVPPQKPSALGEKFEEAAEQFSTISAEAEEFAGPYTLDIALEEVKRMPELEAYAGSAPRLSSDSGTDEDDGPSLGAPTDEVTLTISLTSASGAQVPDIPIALDTSGFEGAPKSLSTGTTVTKTKLTAAGPGPLSVTGSATVAPESVLLYEPTSGTRVQRVITPDKPSQVTDKASLDLTSAPRVTTEISNQTPQPGQPVTDEFTVAGLVGEHTVTVEHTLWQTSTEPKTGTKNDDARAIGTVTSTDIGNGTHTSDEITVPEDFRGWLYFTETIAGDEDTAEWKGIHGQPAETGFAPWTPSAHTEAVLEGSATHDEVAVSGLRPESEAVVIVTAFHSDGQPQQSPKPQGQQLSVQDITVIADENGRAEVSTEPIEMPVGWVTYVTAIAGSEVNSAWTSEWGVPAETVYRPPEETPSSPPAELEEPTSTPPAPPEQPPAPPEEPAQPAAPQQPPVAPVAEQPQAPGAPAELPRTGTSGNGMLIGLGIVFVGLGTTVVLISGHRRRED